MQLEKMNQINHLQELEQLVKEQNCLLYCAGKVAKCVVKYLSRKGLLVDGILVTDKAGNPNEILGVPVFEVKQYSRVHDIKKKTVIICAMENIHEDIGHILSNYEFEKILYVSNNLCHSVEYAMGDYEMEILQQITSINGRIGRFRNQMLKFIPRPCLEYLVINILDHCNLRCKGCDHFACIADPYFVPVDTIKRDVERMSEILHGDNVIKIAVMGGEPLLHPDLLEILRIIRTNFPYAVIRLTTNGLLLLQQKDSFWKVCREQGVTIVNTKYPLNLDYDKMKEVAGREKVRFQYFEDTGDKIVKKSFKKVINLNGDNDPVKSFAECHISNYGNFLMEGKFYGCPFSCQSSRIFNQKFNQNLRIMENDYLDIYEVKNMQELFDFAARPKSYCRYCSGLIRGFEWTRSKQEMCEWVE